MSQENLDLAQRSIDAYNRRHIAGQLLVSRRPFERSTHVGLDVWRVLAHALKCGPLIATEVMDVDEFRL